MEPLLESKNHLYEQVAEKIAKQIDQGALRPGERVPSVRNLKAKLGVSLSTVLQAYLTLESKGLIEARPQSGFYVRLPRQLPLEPKRSNPSATATNVDIGELALEIHENNLTPRVVPLGAATPGKDLIPTKKLYRILRAVSHRHEEESNRYETPSGNIELRRQIARRALDWGGNVSPEEIVVTTGCSEALNLCLRAITKPGDAVAVESPTYFGFLQILEALNLKAIEVPTDPRDGVCPVALESVIQKRGVAAVFLQSNFQNPLGCCIPEKTKKEIVQLLSRKEIPLIEDDIYGDLHHESTRPRTMKSYDRDGNILLCSSFSKTLSPGFRIGWCVPGRYVKQVKRLKLTNSICCSSLPQLALAEMLSTGGYDHFMRRIRKQYAAQMHTMIQAAGRYFPEGTKVTRPKGGTVLWIEFPAKVDSLELYQKALQKEISIVPGPLFSAKRNFHQCIRLNCGHPWSERIEYAMITLGQLASKML
ncbi:MAG: GntR family transcriptional regulator [Acidobacteria bacterium]|nr:MAG: GntR family transcriptional regulator [Acidobacteriota bacterium]